MIHDAVLVVVSAASMAAHQLGPLGSLLGPVFAFLLACWALVAVVGFPFWFVSWRRAVRRQRGGQP